jgi:hypothetical protein
MHKFHLLQFILRHTLLKGLTEHLHVSFAFLQNLMKIYMVLLLCEWYHDHTVAKLPSTDMCNLNLTELTSIKLKMLAGK